MPAQIILASGSRIRSQLLTGASVPHDVILPRIDEDMVKESLLAEGTVPRDIADALASLKAAKISERHPGAIVIGCDQVLDHRGTLFSKPATPEEAITQLRTLRSDTHALLSAAVIYDAGDPVWRHIGKVRMQMRAASDTYIAAYVARNWNSIRHSVGAYKLEEEGVRLFTRVEGDYFHVLGMPLLELLAYLTQRGVIDQ